MKCVVLFGGRGTRMSSLSEGKNKALIDIQGKPVAWYILENLKKHFKEILIITTPEDQNTFYDLSKRFQGVTVSIQPKPEGVPEALNYSHPFLKGEDFFSLCLGDFYSPEFSTVLTKFKKDPGSYLTLNPVSHPEKYGVFDPKTHKIQEKPLHPPSNLAVRGFYILPTSCLQNISSLQKSPRGELEIVDLINQLNFNTVQIEKVFDLGSISGLELFKKYQFETSKK